MTVIALFVEGTFLPSREGATRRFLGISRYLPRNCVRVIVVHCYRGWSDLSLISQESFCTYALSPDLYYTNPELIAELLELESVDICLFSEAETVVRIGWPLRRLMPALKIWYECHDYERRYYESTGCNSKVVRAAARTQKLALYLADQVSCFSQDDYDGLSQEAGSPLRIEIVPFGIELHGANYTEYAGQTDQIAFVGSLYHRPNQIALADMAEKVAPGLADQGVRVAIIGDAPAEIVNRYSSPVLRFCGMVDDLTAELARSALAIAPVVSGSGIKVKVLDYLAASRPIVATELALRGISTQGSIVVNSLDDYPRVISSLLASPEERAGLRHESRKAAELYSWENIGAPLAQLVNGIRKSQTIPRLEAEPPELESQPYFLDDFLSQERFLPLPHRPLEAGSVLRLSNSRIVRWLPED
jgi:glycosyltransferase involved in cell wall biosynthesis